MKIKHNTHTHSYTQTHSYTAETEMRGSCGIVAAGAAVVVVALLHFVAAT